MEVAREAKTNPVSKFAADIYVQDYAQRNEIDAAVFRMSCISRRSRMGSMVHKCMMELGWTPEVSAREGVGGLVEWINDNKNLFE